MIVPLTLGDFLERAERVYGERVAVVDEPNPPGGGLGRFTYAEFGAMARSLAGALDDMGVGQDERVAIVSPNAARFLVSLFGVSGYGRILVPVNFRLNAEEIRYIIGHSGASVLLVDPELDEPLRGIPVKHRIVLGTATDGRLFKRADTRPRLSVADENGSERLRNYPVQYEYSIVTGYNHSQVRHRGAGIFLHVNGRGATAGCVSAPRAFLKRLMNRLDPARVPVLAVAR